MTDQAEACPREGAQAALDAVRRAINNWGDPVPPFAEQVVAVLENLDARLKALEGK